MADLAKTLEELRRLPIDQRIQLVEDLWDTIAEDPAADRSAVSSALAIELERRLQEYSNDPASAQPLDAVLERLWRLVENRSE